MDDGIVGWSHSKWHFYQVLGECEASVIVNGKGRNWTVYFHLRFPFQRFNMLAKTRQTWKLDGMNTAEYEIISRQYLPLYTNITVNIGTEAGLHPPPPTKPTGQAAGKAREQIPAKGSGKLKEGHQVQKPWETSGLHAVGIVQVLVLVVFAVVVVLFVHFQLFFVSVL